MLTVGFILLLCPVHLVKAQSEFHPDKGLIFAKEGDQVNITCLYQSDMAMHFSWYKHKHGQKPKLISNFYKHDSKATFHNEFKDNSRFNMINKKGITCLEIKELQFSDTAMYYCGSAHSNIVEFGEGTELIVQASQPHSLSVRQEPVLEAAHLGNSVTLQCTVIINRCAGAHSVYWFRHNSEEAHSGIIYTHGDSTGWCKKSPKAGSPKQMCVYSLPKTNLSPSDAGTYYCAVAACGDILFGNGTNLDITGQGCHEYIHTLVLFSIMRSFVLLCCVIGIVIYFCKANKAKSSFRKTTREKNLHK